MSLTLSNEQHLQDKRGVNAELRRRRLEVFREKLLSTDLPISERAPMVGFRALENLRRSFRKAYGMSPRQCRYAARNISPTLDRTSRLADAGYLERAGSALK